MLNDTRVRNAKAGERDYSSLTSTACTCWCARTAASCGRFAYRLDGKQKQIALGAYPVLGPADAREQRKLNRKLLASGKDPSLERRLLSGTTTSGG